MTDNTKRIIAREVLALLTIGILAILTRIIPNPIVLYDKEKPIDLLTEKRVEVTDDNIGMKYYAVVSTQFDMFDKVESERQISKFLKTANVVKKEMIGLNDKLLIILLLTYPAYWIVRFIIWAVSTLRRK